MSEKMRPPESIRGKPLPREPDVLCGDAASGARQREAFSPAYTEQILDQIMGGAAGDSRTRDAACAAIDSIALDVQREVARCTALLKAPLAAAAHRCDDGGQLADALQALREQIDALDPAVHRLEPGGMSRLMGIIPGVGTPMERYFSRYDKASPVIDEILEALDDARGRLRRDNITLLEDQHAIRKLNTRLEEAVEFVRRVDEGLKQRLAAVPAGDDRVRSYVAEDVQYVLRRRLQDLQQQHLVSQQAILAIEIIVRNNQQLIRSIDHAMTVTVTALRVAVTLAFAHTGHRALTERLKGITDAGRRIVTRASARQPARGELRRADLDRLREALAEVLSALADITQFRETALPEMAENVLRIEKASADTPAA